MRPRFQWRLPARTLELGRRTLIMGVLNVTPDSFSDGGCFYSPASAIEHGLQMLAAGADIIDVGGESTRPGTPILSGPPDPSPANGTRVAPPEAPKTRALKEQAVTQDAVMPEEELRRVLPVILELRSRAPDAVISIDTYKATVARAAVAAGAEIVNDVGALRWDPAMPATAAELGCGVVLMHSRGRPEEWRELPPLGAAAVELVCAELADWARSAEAAGIGHDRLVLDPGFGFGKHLEENYPLLARFDELHRLGYPLLAGTSRKSFIGHTISRQGEPIPPERRLYGTLATVTAAILKGAHIVRVHDVDAVRETAAVADAILHAGLLPVGERHLV